MLSATAPLGKGAFRTLPALNSSLLTPNSSLLTNKSSSLTKAPHSYIPIKSPTVSTLTTTAVKSAVNAEISVWRIRLIPAAP